MLPPATALSHCCCLLRAPVEEAKNYYRAGEFRDALLKFAHMLAATDDDSKNSIISNIGSCLHMMGEHDLAEKYYTVARNSFANTKVGRVSRFFFGDANPARVKFIEKRMALNADGQPFDPQVYLTETGQEMRWPDEPPKNKEEAEAKSRAGNNDEPMLSSTPSTPAVQYSYSSYFSCEHRCARLKAGTCPLPCAHLWTRRPML